MKMETLEATIPSFQNETEYICRRLVMCNKYGKQCALQPYQCTKALRHIKLLKDKLVLGNNPSARMTYEEVRIAKDYFFLV